MKRRTFIAAHIDNSPDRCPILACPGSFKHFRPSDLNAHTTLFSLDAGEPQL